MSAEFPYPEDSLTPLSIRAGKAMLETMRRLTVSSGIEMNIDHAPILFNLWRADGQSQNELACRIFKDKSVVARSIQQLETGGWLCRVPSSEDRRIKHVFLTEKGKDHLIKLLPHLKTAECIACQGVSEEDLAKAKQVLQKIYLNLLENMYTHE